MMVCRAPNPPEIGGSGYPRSTKNVVGGVEHGLILSPSENRSVTRDAVLISLRSLISPLHTALIEILGGGE
jgi:hypothetical protein